MNSNAPNAMIARLKQPLGPPNTATAKGRGKSPNAIIGLEKCHKRLLVSGRLGFSSDVFVSGLRFSSCFLPQARALKRCPYRGPLCEGKAGTIWQSRICHEK